MGNRRHAAQANATMQGYVGFTLWAELRSGAWSPDPACTFCGRTTNDGATLILMGGSWKCEGTCGVEVSGDHTKTDHTPMV